MSLPMESTLCPFCGTRNRLEKNARVKCSECGYVLQEPDNGDITYIQ